MKRVIALCMAFALALPALAAPASEPAREPLSPAQRWALSLSAPLSLENAEDLVDTLAGKPDAVDTREMSQQTLAGWSIHDRRELLQTLDWLANKGHSAVFSELAARQADASQAAADHARALREFDAMALHRAEIVREHREAFGDRSLAAWDYSRYVSLCRWGYSSGYWTDEEAWTHIMNAARQVQRQFSSWEEFAENYHAGFRFYSVRAWLNDKGTRSLYLQQLLHDPDSPWVQLPWDLDLGP